MENTSNTKLKIRTKRKTNPEIVETLDESRKHPAWGKVAWILSGSRNNYSQINLKEIDEKTKAGDTIVVPGKVLGTGKITKKVRVCALSFSKGAEKAIKKEKGEAVTVLEEIKKNAKAEGVKILR